MTQNISRKAPNIFWGIFICIVTLIPLIWMIKMLFYALRCHLESLRWQQWQWLYSQLFVSQFTFNSNSLLNDVTFLFFLLTLSTSLSISERLQEKSNYSSGIILTPTGQMEKVSLFFSLNFILFQTTSLKSFLSPEKVWGGTLKLNRQYKVRHK